MNTTIKKYNDLVFEDLDTYDINMIKERAMDNFLQSSEPNQGASAVIEALFAYIFLKGMRIVKDETKKDEWARPSSAWYSDYRPKKTDW